MYGVSKSIGKIRMISTFESRRAARDGGETGDVLCALGELPQSPPP